MANRVRAATRATLVLLLALICFSAFSQEEKRIKIYSSDKKDNNTIRRFVVQLENAVDSVFRPSEVKKDFNISVVLMPQLDRADEAIMVSEAGSGLKITLSDNVSRWEKSYNVHRGILEALVLKKYGIKIEGNTSKVPDWYLAGLLHRAQRKISGQEGMSLNLYPGTYSLVVTDQLPDCRNLIKYPLKYSDGVAWKLYSECCELLVESVMKLADGRSALKEIVAQGAANVPAEEAFIAEIAKQIRNKDIGTYAMSDSDIVEDPSDDCMVGLWYKSSMTRGSVNIFYPGTSDFIKRRFESMQVVNYKVAVKDGQEDGKAPDPAEGSCKISEIPGRLDQIDDRQFLILKQEKYFTELIYQAPIVFHKSLRRILNSFSYLKKNDMDSFSEEYSEGAKDFYAAASRMSMIEEFLSKEENRYVGLMKGHPLSLKVTEEALAGREGIWPSLEKFMDAEERKY